MKTQAVHYKNKYPNGRVEFSEDKLDAYDDEGAHVVALRKGGNGLIVDMSQELGALDQHDLSPIPKNARVHKLHKNGNIGLAEEASERVIVSKQIVTGGKILSIEEYQKKGFKVDKDGNVELPAQAAKSAE